MARGASVVALDFSLEISIWLEFLMLSFCADGVYSPCMVTIKRH